MQISNRDIGSCSHRNKDNLGRVGEEVNGEKETSPVLGESSEKESKRWKKNPKSHKDRLHLGSQGRTEHGGSPVAAITKDHINAEISFVGTAETLI